MKNKYRNIYAEIENRIRYKKIENLSIKVSKTSPWDGITGMCVVLLRVKYEIQDEVNKILEPLIWATEDRILKQNPKAYDEY